MKHLLIITILALIRPSGAFIVVPTATHRLISVRTAAKADEAQEHLKDMTKTWENLQKKEKEIEKHPDGNAAMDLAEELLETALDAVQTQEVIEEDHVVKAHGSLEKAVRDEKVLEEAYKEVHHDAADADAILGTYEHDHILEDLEKRRELAVSDISHHVEDYVETRLRAAKEAEMHAKEEEDEAKRSLEQLQRNEQELKATLEELKALKEDKKEIEQMKQ